MDVVAALTLCLPNLHPYEIFEMDALFAYELASRRAKLQAAPARQQSNDAPGGGWKPRPGGGMEMHVTSADQLRSLFKTPLGQGNLKI